MKRDDYKTIAVSPEIHQQAKINAAVKGKHLKQYVEGLIKADTENATPTTTKKGK